MQRRGGKSARSSSSSSSPGLVWCTEKTHENHGIPTGWTAIFIFFCNIMTFHTFSWFSRIKFIGRWFLYINIWNFPIAVWNFPEGTSGGSWRLPGWTARNHDEGPLAFSQRCLWPSTMINHTWCNHYLVGGWATTLKNMSSSVGMILPYIWKTKNVQTTNQL